MLAYYDVFPAERKIRPLKKDNVITQNPLLDAPEKDLHKGRSWMQDRFSQPLFRRALRSLALVLLLLIYWVPAAQGQQASGLVASYGFDEGTGQSVSDASGNGNTGTISDGTWVTDGRFGGALAFDGANDKVSVADVAALDLTDAMTLEAWVYPTALSGWRTVLLKEASNDLAYALYAHDNAPRSAGYARIGGSIHVQGPDALPLNTWTHLAVTYDGAVLRLYENGAEVGTRSVAGTIATSSGPLQIGGNGVWGEYFSGRIDEVRIYSRALTSTEIQSDMAQAIGSPGPKLSVTLPENGSTLAGPTVDIQYSVFGDLTEVSHVHFRLDDGPDIMDTTLADGQFQLTDVAPGNHTLDGFLVRADHSKIDGSDAAQIGITVAATPAAPTLTINSPQDGSTVGGSTVNIQYTTDGDLTEVSHVHFRLDGGPDIMDTTLADGRFQLTDVAPGIHTLDGFLVRADHSKVDGSDAAQISFTVTATPAAPTLTINSPQDGSTLSGSTVTVQYATAGDLTDVSHAHFQLDSGPDIMDTTLADGQFQLTDVAPGVHTLDGFLVRADHSKIDGSDAVQLSFTVDVPEAEEIGAWSAPVDLPTVAVNLIQLHTGKLMFWAGDFSTAPNYGELWDPVTNEITPAPNPFSNIFCSAHVALADGGLLVAGGHDKGGGFLGIPDSNIFDPVTETWTALPSMSFRRWYPTLTMLGDGRAIVTSGSEDSESEFVEIPEIYDPVTNSWTQLEDARLSVPQYPMMFLLADGRLLQTGTTEHPTNTQVLDIDSQQWSVVDSRVIDGGSAVMYRPGRILKSGSSSNDGATPSAPSLDSTYVLDMSSATPTWRETAPMEFPRTFHNLTSLPDGTVLVTSGSRRKSETDSAPAVLEAELWSPDTESWNTMAPMQTPRIYHSTAVLLPDGRVAVSGSGNIGGAIDRLNLELYSPPYLFRGSRPSITSVMTQLEYGSSFTVETPDAVDISAVNLIRPGAATHNFDQEQRFVPLSFSQGTGGELEVEAPSNPNLAPPGYYMLFIVNSDGVPSIAEFVRFPAPYEDTEPPTRPLNLTASGSTGTVSLTWQPATDNSTVASYGVYRSTVPGFTPDESARVGQSSSTAYSDVGLAAGTFYYKVIAVDIAGNKSLASNEASATVSPDVTPPTVSISSPLDGEPVSGAISISAAANDDVGVAGVQFALDGVALGAEDTVAPYSLSWNSATVPNGVYSLIAIARDASNNATESVAIAITVSNQIPTDLVAAYSFDEGAGQSVSDASGNGNTGTISDATWVTEGRLGGALAFDGANDIVTVADAPVLDLTDAMTLEAWVYPTALSGWRTVLLKETSNELAYALYAHDNAPRSAGYARIGGSTNVQGPGALPLNTWTHLALTYDGAVLRLYENGAEVGTRSVAGTIATSSGPLQIGGNALWGEYFSGRIDEVRIYSRALTSTQIQSDMAQAIGSPGPKLSVTLPENGSSLAGPTVDIQYTVSGDLTDVSHVHFRLDSGPDIMDTTLADGQFQLTDVAPGDHTLDGFLVRADQSKIDGSDATTINFTVSIPDNVPPTVVLTTPRDGDVLEGASILVASASDDVGVAGVQFALDGVALGAEDTVAPYSLSWNSATVPNGVYSLTAIARDVANNSTESIDITVTAWNTQQQVPADLVAAYSFDEGAGQSVSDASGNGNTGTISDATWVTEGRLGGALAFDGANDIVTVADAPVLDLTDAMTLEAWVYPTALSGWRTVLLKETSNELAYALYAHDNAPRSAGYARIGGSTNVQGPGALPLNTWTHLALTYDGAVLRLYENGAEVGTRSVAGTIATSSGPLQIGGNALWGEYFSGRIDEVRIYSRALTSTEIQSDMAVPVLDGGGPPVQGLPTRSTPIVVDESTRRVWVVNPDNDSVAAINADTLLLELEVPVDAHPASIALDTAGQVWVTCRDDDSVWVLDADTGGVVQVLQLAWGSAPVSIVFEPDGATGYIANEGSGTIQKFDAPSHAIADTMYIGPTPRALAVTGDGKRLLVTRFISADQGATVWSLNLDDFIAGPTIDLPVDTDSEDGSLGARGLPNYLVGIAINPWIGEAWITAKKDNILRGGYLDGNPLTFETTVRALVGSLDLARNEEELNRRLDIDNVSQPSAIAFSEAGDRVFVTLQGNNLVIVLDLQGNEITRASTGLAPQGIVIDPVSSRVFTKDLMSRSVTVFDALGLLEQGTSDLPRAAQIQTVSDERLSPDVLRGKQIFYDAADPRMNRDGYLSCATCHLDGGHDGRVWDFTGRGEGLRNTISLKGQGGDAGAPLHWSGNFDEVQDFENDIRNRFGGAGFMDDVDYFSGTISDPLGDSKVGLSEELDALAAYVNSLVGTSRSPHRQPDGAMTLDAEAGAAFFMSLGCDVCHNGPRFSDSPSGLRHDVGTIKLSSGDRIGGLFDGVDTPILPGLWHTGPYLHDGSALTLHDALTTANPDGLHGDVSGLSAAELDQLVRYLLQLELPAP